MKRIILNLTEAEATAILRSEGLHVGRGVSMSVALRRANMKLIGAVAAAASGLAEVAAPERGREGERLDPSTQVTHDVIRST